MTDKSVAVSALPRRNLTAAVVHHELLARYFKSCEDIS